MQRHEIKNMEAVELPMHKANQGNAGQYAHTPSKIRSFLYKQP
jgi:hypothetical protein